MPVPMSCYATNKNTNKMKRTSSELPTLKRTKRIRKAPRQSNQVLGRLTGVVRPSGTTLAQYPGPFTGVKKVTFIYENELTVVGGASNLLTAAIACNSLFDVDKSGSSCFGNKQPLYYDTLLTVSGPYRQYKVISWKTTYTILNKSTTCPITVWALPPHTSTAELDSAAEADNWPGVKRLYLGSSGDSKNQGTMTVKGHVNDVYKTMEGDVNLVGPYNGDPASIIYGGLVIHGSDGTTAPSVYVAIKHEAYAELTYLDSLVS